MGATIKDVAKLAGVSPSTVSRTCANHPSISNETKEKVRKAMDELGYEPNFQASNLASKISKTIGIVLPISDSEMYKNAFHLEAIRGIGEFCNQQQYMNTLVTGNSEKELLHVIKSMMKTGKVDGFIMLYSKKDDIVLEYLCNESITFSLIGKASVHTNQIVYVDNDNVSAAKEATDYLIEMGHTRIAFLYTDEKSMFIRDRKNGYMLSLAEHQIPYEPRYCLEQSYYQSDFEEDLATLFESNDPPTAIIASDDILAVALEKRLFKLNKRIPEDVSMIAFNNSLFSKLMNPPLTCVDVNPYQLGVEAASQTINHIENPNLLATKIIVPHKIIERKSCKEII